MEIQRLINKPNLTKSEAKKLNLAFDNILPDCYCGKQERKYLQELIKRKLSERVK